jgi:transcriptional regulator with AAA-type ATPase domain
MVSYMKRDVQPAGELVFAERRWGAQRPLAVRLAFIVLPPALLLCLLVSWLGFKAASSTLEDSLPAVPFLEAKIQAEKFEQLLKSLSSGLFQIAQLAEHNPQAIRARLPAYFHECLPFVAELGFKSKNGQSFFLLRDLEGQLVPVNLAFASQDPHAAFTQTAVSHMKTGAISLFPAVLYRYELTPGQRLQRPVIRMALPLDRDRGALVLGLDLEALHAMLAVYMGADSPLRTPMHEDNPQLAFFFEDSGWMLFELGNRLSAADFFPDASRRGYEGDIGRPGFDTAFRPYALHESYWRMVTDIRAGKAGFFPASARHYATSYPTASANVCYVPVRFAAAPGDEPRVVGGIAFLEASRLPIEAFYRAAATGVFILAVSLVVLVLLVAHAGRKLAAPLRATNTQLQSMLHAGQLVPLQCSPACEEQQVLLEAGNELIARNIALQADLARMQSEMQLTYSVMPIDLDGVFGTLPLHENFGLVGSSLAMQGVREEVQKAGRSGADVLIWGETGTGKELVAAAIHQTGVSTEGPFISINCGALDENLLLDSLFGHVRGAFSEAKSDRKGAFLSAEGGTLFLDEIANASLKVQQALLRALSVRRIRPLGADLEIPFTSRVVTATNVDLRKQVRKGLFREDLYYRLAIINIATPSLRRRKEDIPELAAHFIREAGKRLTRAKVRLSRGALEAMMEHDWPGNVRELKNCITRAMAFMEGDLILRQHVLIEADSAPDQPQVAREIGDSRAEDGGNTLPANGGKNEQFEYAWEYLWSRHMPPADPSAAPPPTAAVADAPADLSATSISPRGELAPLDPVPPAANGATREAAARTSPPQPRTSASIPGLNDRQLLAVQYMRKNGGITRSEYENLTGGDISSRTMQNDLRMLIELGVIRRVGGGPKTRYTLRQYS